MKLVEPAINVIQQAASLIALPDRDSLRIATSYSFASCWLIPRLKEIRQLFGIEIEVIPSRDPAVLRAGLANFAIWGGLGRVEGLASDILFDMQATPVAAQALSADHIGPIADAELAQLPLLEVRSPSGMWERWFALGGFRPATLNLRGFDSLQMVYETAAAGSGATLAVPLLAEQLLDQRKLVPIGMPRRIGESYRLYRAERTPTDAHNRFVTWLNDAVEGSVAQFDAISSPAFHAQHDQDVHRRVGSRTTR